VAALTAYAAGMPRAADRLTHALVEQIGRRTRPARERIALTGFFLGTEGPLDRFTSRTYFELSHARWAEYEVEDSHHLAFRDGLRRLSFEPASVVDLGTGAGGTAALMARTWPSATVFGIDSSRQMVRRARQQHAGVPNLRFEVGDGLRLQVAEESVELVTSLNYMPFPGEVRRVLRPGGSVLVASTFQGVGSAAIEANWKQHGFSLQAQDDAEVGSFEVYRRG
jgi:SAM-dependent methyltransferase